MLIIGYKVAELFAGGGLMAVGLRAAGLDIVWANDFDKSAVAAYRYNHGDHIVLGDITTIDPDDIPDVDIIAGGPPCQDYSVAGKGAGEGGERGKLVWAYLNVIERKQSKAFIFENVKGLVGKRHRPTFDALLTQFERIGYTVSWRVINAWDYGVAQKRERVFIVGIRADLGFTYQFPEPEPTLYRTKVLRDIIGDLPEPSEFYNRPTPHNDVIYKIDSHIANHQGYGVRKDEAAYAGCIPPGGNWRSLPQDDQVRFMKGAANSLGGRAGFLRKAAWLEASPTILANPMGKATCTLHPEGDRPRRFTVRECLRIQSVPDTYVLPDTISLSAQYRIVGNGVASRVAYILSVALAEQLAAADTLTLQNVESKKEAV